MNMQEIAKALKEAGTVKISKAEIEPFIREMADEIYPDPKRNPSGRSYEQVYSDCTRIAIEFAVIKVLKGKRNPKKFNHRDPDSYIWDTEAYGLKFETKRHKTGAKYFTYSKKSINTYFKHCLSIDYLITAYMESSSENYLVEFAMIANSKTFETYFQPSKYNNNWYYDHNNGYRFNQCIPFGLREATI